MTWGIARIFPGICNPDMLAIACYLMSATLTDMAYDGLRRKLARGELRAGQRIVNRTVAKELKVSQTPLREALTGWPAKGWWNTCLAPEPMSAP